MEQEFTEAEKQVYAILLAVGLLYVIAKVAYEQLAKERFSFSNVFHPVKPILAKERQFLTNFLVPFQSFDAQTKKMFLKRFAWFKSKKPFVFYGDIKNKEEIKAYVAASATLVTLGMQDFKFEKSISRIIIVYPSKYYSRIGREHHIGEYNPRLRGLLVFSAEDLAHGFQIPNDGRNLGIHEVAHALMVETRKKSSWEAMRFKVGLMRVKGIFDSADFQSKLERNTFLR